MHLLFLSALFEGKLVESFCRMLIHSLWQGLVFTIVTGIVMMLTKKASAAVRYNMIAALFFLFIAVCVFTFVRELNLTNITTPALPYAASGGNINENVFTYFFKSLIDFASSHASVLMIAWFIIFCFKGVKLATAFVYHNRVKSNAIIPPALWKNKIAGLCEQLQVTRAVSLFESGIVKIPVVIGHLRPIIFIPVGLLNGLPAAEVEAILLHELAHIRRNDYIVNMVQVIAESIFFFNPALLWMSHILREERENCCDDLAVGQVQNKKQYIQALISFKEHAVYAAGYSTAFFAGRNQLLKRVTRIVINKNSTLDATGKIFFIASLFLSAFLLIAKNYSGNGIAGKQIPEKATALSSMALVNTLPGETDNTVINIKSVASVKDISRQDNARVNKEPGKQSPALKRKPVVTETGTNILVTNNHVITSNDDALSAILPDSKPAYQQEVALNKEQLDPYRVQAEKDRKQAEADRVQAMKDREQAVKDMKQAELDRQQAERDREQAEKDRKQADKDRQQAEKDRYANQING